MTNSEDRMLTRVATSLQVHLLGKFQVRVQERAIPDADWRRRRAKHLVALLALTPGHILHRDQVLDTFWPSAAPDDAANSLYQTLHVARRILCPSTQPCGYLQLRAETLSLCLDGAAWVDTEVFEAEVKGAQGSQDPESLRAALQLYRGELETVCKLP
jgi:DNA-binding SARP family transcriptional activator